MREFKLHTETGKEFHKNTIFAKNENLYALIEEDSVVSILEWDQVMIHDFSIRVYTDSSIRVYQYFKQMARVPLHIPP